MNDKHIDIDANGSSKEQEKDFLEMPQTGTKETVLRWCEEGRYPGYPPFGYIRNLRNQSIEDYETRQNLVIHMFKLMAAGDNSIDDMAKFVRDEGLTVLPEKSPGGKESRRLNERNKIHQILTNPFYTGRFMWDGKLWDNRGINRSNPPSYKILISDTLFKKVQSALKKNQDKRIEKTGKPFLYRGFLECRYCGCHLVGEEHNKGKYIYYRCSYGKKSVDPNWYQKKYGQKNCIQRRWKEEEITEGVIEALTELKFDGDNPDSFKEEVRMEVMVNSGDIEDELKFYQKRGIDLREKLDHFLISEMSEIETFSQDEPNNLNRIIEKIEEMKKELAEVETDIHQLEAQYDIIIEKRIENLENVKKFVNSFIKILGESNRQNPDPYLATKQIMLQTIFRKAIAGKPWFPSFGISNAGYPYNGIDFSWNEPFYTLNSLYKSDRIKKFEDRERAKNQPQEKVKSARRV